MDVQALVKDFLNSSHGAGALSALEAQGVTGDDATNALAAAAEAGHAHAEEHASSSGLLGDHPGKSFFAAFAAGLVRGDGFLGSLMDGGEGVLTGRVAEAIAEKCGVDPSTAATIAAAATPYVVGYLKQKLG